MKTLRELLTNPPAGEAANAERLRRAEAVLAEQESAEMRWYLAALTALGAWLASLCLFGFIMESLRPWENRGTCAVLGVVLLAGCVAGIRCKPGMFVKQCLLAFSVAAQAMIYWGWMPEDDTAVQTAMLIAIGLAAVLYVLYPQGIHRVLTCIAALQMVHVWLIYHDSGWGWMPHKSADPATQSEWLAAYWLLQLGGLAWCWMRVHRRSAAMAPLGYALAASLTISQVIDLGVVTQSAQPPTWALAEAHLQGALLLVPVGAALLLLMVITWIAGGLSAVRKQPTAFAVLVAVTAIVVGMGAGGMLPALILLALGLAVEEWLLVGCGLILLPTFLCYYYSSLNFDLLTKSMVLAGTGAVLLGLRAGLRKWWQPNLQEAQ